MFEASKPTPDDTVSIFEITRAPRSPTVAGSNGPSRSSRPFSPDRPPQWPGQVIVHIIGTRSADARLFVKGRLRS